MANSGVMSLQHDMQMTDRMLDYELLSMPQSPMYRGGLLTGQTPNYVSRRECSLIVEF